MCVIPKFIVQRTNPNTDRGAREELPVLLGVPCNGHEVILRKLFSVAAAADVQPLGVDDAWRKCQYGAPRSNHPCSERLATADAH